MAAVPVAAAPTSRLARLARAVQAIEAVEGVQAIEGVEGVEGVHGAPAAVPAGPVADVFTLVAGLHEVFAAAPADCAAASGFAAGLARRAAQRRRMLWVRQDILDAEAGGLHAPGLVELGLDPGAVVLVRVRDVASALRAGGEAARCPGLGAVVLELWGESGLIDLTATRRLSLAARAAGLAAIVVRAAARPGPSAAVTRWQVRARPSRALEAGAPGHPSFAATLLRHRGGVPPRDWHVEWDRDRVCFQPRTAAAAPLPVAVVSAAADRPGEAGGRRIRRAG